MAKSSDKSKMSFRKLMALKECDHDRFESLTPAWGPGGSPTIARRVYGGHIYAQATWAASQTVADGLHIHNVTGHFLLPGTVDMPFTYHVKRVRDGGIYSLRSVEVFQDSEVAGHGKTPCFVSTISYKRVERPGKTIKFGHQNVPKDHIKTEYKSVLNGRRIEDHPPAPRGDALWPSFITEAEDDFPGVETRKVDMHAYNGTAVRGGGPDSTVVSRWRQLTFYRMRQEEHHHKDEDNLNLHAAAHMYASDRNSLFLVLRALGYDDNPAFMGSLLHTVVFHDSAEDYRMLDKDGKAKWWVQEGWTSNSGENRVCHNSRLWDYERGLVIGTTTQDGMMRLQREDNASSRL